MIRPTIAGDFPALIALADGTGVFKPPEITALQEVLDDWLSHNQALGHRCVTSQRDGEVIGFAYYAPAAMTDRTWYLYWIAVSKRAQTKGLGGEMLRFLEHEIRQAQGRMLLIETSSLEHYESTRRFYLKHDYEHATRIDDYYAEGDHLELFRKRFRY